MLYTDGREAAEGAHVSSVVKIEGFQSECEKKNKRSLTFCSHDSKWKDLLF